MTAFDPSTASAAGGFDPASARLPSSFDTGSAKPLPVSASSQTPPADIVNNAAQLWVKAGGDPSVAHLMGVVAANESAGNPKVPNPKGTGIGLWQINPKAHGPGNWTDPLTNAKKAVELYNQSGLAPWQDSKDKGAYGGWGSAVGGFQPLPAPSTAKPLLPPNPVAQTAKKVVKGVESADVGLAARWDEVRRHPATAAMDILGSLQRGVGEAVREGNDPTYGQGDVGTRLKRSLHDIGQAVFMTREGTLTGRALSEGQAAALRTRTTESVRAGLSGALGAATGGHVGLSTHAQIDQRVNATKWIPAPLKPYVAGYMKGAEDTGVQTASDPLTALGGVIFKGVGNLLHVATTFEEAHNVARAMGVGQHFEHLKPIYEGSHTIAQRVLDHPAVSFFRSRPELENFSLGATPVRGQKFTGATGGFTAQGKKIRMQLENKVTTQANNDRFIDESLATPADREGRLRDYIAQYGDGSQRAQLGKLGHAVTGPTNAYLSKTSGIGSDVGKFLEKFRGMSDEEQTNVLNTVRNDARDGSLAKKTESAVRLWDTADGKPSQILKPGSVISDYRKVPHESQAVAAIKRAGEEVAPVHAIRDIMRTSIFLNPLPHGIKNVGQLAYLAGGFPAVFRGFRAMATGEIDRDRLAKIGALPEYTQHQLEESFWGKTIPGWAGFAGKMQAGMQHMEDGWRQGLLETLDAKLGKSADLKDELLKGNMLQDHLGDYGNQSAFVHSFAALGGPFAAFRMGIVPKNVLRAIANDPQRVLLALRAKYNLQAQRPNKSRNEIEPGGPMDDFLRMTSDPLGFLLSPSTLGAIGGAAQQAEYGQHDTPGQVVARTVEQYNPFGEYGEIFNALANGARPNEKENLTDRLIDVTMLAFGAYFKRSQTMKAAAAQGAGERKQASKAYKPILNALDSLGGASPAASASTGGGGFDPSTATAGGGFDPASAR